MEQPKTAAMLADPWRVRRRSREAVVEDDAFAELDGPKRAALRGLAATVPTYLVVGPPGVGKTMLATEVVRRRFASEPSSRMLLTAQGHDALDNLQVAVERVLTEAGGQDILLIRTPAEDREPTAADSNRKAADILNRLRKKPETNARDAILKLHGDSARHYVPN